MCSFGENFFIRIEIWFEIRYQQRVNHANSLTEPSIYNTRNGNPIKALDYAAPLLDALKRRNCRCIEPALEHLEICQECRERKHSLGNGSRYSNTIFKGFKD